MGETLLGGVVIALVAFVATQVVASPRSSARPAARTLTARDSASIAGQYHEQIAARGGTYTVPGWLSEIQIARLQAAAARDLAGLDSAPPLAPDSVRALVAAGDTGGYLGAMLAEDARTVTRWRERAEPVRVWVQPYSTEPKFSPELVAPARRGFTAWNELGLGASFELVDDSTLAEVHVTWSERMPKPLQIGTTFRMTGGAGWVAFAHVVLSTAYDVYTVQNAARHEAGHVLGLGHSPDARDIMAAETEGKQYVITDADRRTARVLYSLPPGVVP